METHRRGSDGRRFFTTQFKQEQIARVVRQELTLSELARELAVSPSVVRRWQHLSTKGSSAAVASNQEVVPVSELRAAQQRIRDLERALGALYPNSTRQFGKGNLTSQRRVVGWKHIVGERMVAASLPRSSSRSRSLGSYARS